MVLKVLTVLKVLVLMVLVLCVCGVRLQPGLAAQGAVAYRLGTFEVRGARFVGLVVDDAVARLDQALDRPPREMGELIARYDELKPRLQEAAAAVAGQGARPRYGVSLSAVKVLPPVLPGTLLNAAVNYVEHEREMSGSSTQGAAAPAKLPDAIPGIWPRKPGDTRHNPYLFPKLRSAVIADGEAIRIPAGRDRIDWECELTVVVGRTASRVPVERAADHIFGYTLENDVSDRAGRGDGRHGSDWLIGKSHDTFAPLGPFIVPREFVKDPQKLAITFTLNGKVMQDSNTSRMTHTVYELLSYASHILTLRPGDVIATGSPAGVGTARATPIYFKAGDRSVCTIESIGTLSNPVQ
ncbi:MAG: fumarylacetoacetate hydrolase family protein [Vicinamibacterales bacterium]